MRDGLVQAPLDWRTRFNKYPSVLTPLKHLESLQAVYRMRMGRIAKDGTRSVESIFPNPDILCAGDWEWPEDKSTHQTKHCKAR